MQNTDIFIIGGGINGAAIAADASGRGLSVILCEKNDLAAATSSASTKLIHGGLRYLEYYEFKLVRIALREREILMRKAPHLISPLEFILPQEKHSRPAWLIRLGLFFYDHLSRRNFLPGSKYLNLKKNVRGDALLAKITRGFSYYDCFTDDARLTLLNALAAKEQGATILTQHKFISAQCESDHWKIKIKNLMTKKIFYVNAKALVNASGPWIEHVQKNITHTKSIRSKLVKGSHIIVPKLYEGEFAYILQNTDNRIIFTIPYQQQFTLIGTTDLPFNQDLDKIKITRGEENYLCSIVNKYFKKSISTKDICWSYAGTRCLQAEKTYNLASITRDYKLVLESEQDLPLLTVVGGKITTHRSLAEEALDRLKVYFPLMKPAWTATAKLPGGDFKDNDFQKFYLQLQQEFSWLPEDMAYRYAKNYGTRVHFILAGTNGLDDLGEKIAEGLYQKELEYLIQHEWATTAEDILWRRTKLGLFLSPLEQKKLSAWLKKYK